MKTLTVKQPWASLIIEGIKDIENRTWKCPQKYIGERILIHASMKPDNVKLEIECQASVKEIQMFSVLGRAEEDGLFGAIIGSVEIVDCILDHPSIWADKWMKKHYHAFGTMMSYDIQPYNWVLANPIKFPEPIPYKGKLRFWDYPDIIDQNGNALREPMYGKNIKP